MSSTRSIAKVGIAVAIASSLTVFGWLATAAEPSSTRAEPPLQLAQGMWGGRWGGMMGDWCDPMMEGMMIGGQMPPGADPAQLPEPQSSGAKLLNQYCTQCHGLPTPKLHSAAGWPPVAQRMVMRMQWMSNHGRTLIQAPTSAELQTLADYLQKHASK